jgi:geranylgeranyl pyrophosphate synthase
MQFVDDVLDFTGSTLQLGKPALNDLRSGLATAPVLYAAEEHPQVCTNESSLLTLPSSLGVVGLAPILAI